MTRIDVRRPALVVAVGAVLAVLSLLLPLDVSGAGRSDVEPPGVSGTSAGDNGGPECDQVRDSLRPTAALPPPRAMPSGSTMARILARGRLVAGVDQGKYLLGYRDPQTGELAGSDIDIVRSIAAAIFGDKTRVQFVVVDIADRAGLIQRGQADVVVNSFTVTCKRQRTVEFSTAYIDAAQRLLVPTGTGVREIEQLRGQPVCTSIGATNEVVLRRFDVQVVSLPGIPDCMVALQRGTVAAVTSDDVILAGLAAQDPQTRVVGRPLASTRYAVGMSPSQPDLVRFVNALLERDRASGALAASERRWLGPHLDRLPAVPPALYRD